MPGLLELLLSGGNPQLRLGGEDTPAGGGLLDALGQRIMQQQYNPQMGGAAPLNAQVTQPAQQAVEAPQRAMAAPQVSMPQQGGGGLLGRLFGGGGGSRGQSYNGTVNWLTGKGYSPEAASLIAGNKDMLGKVIISSGSPGEASAYQQRAQALIQAGIDPNSAEGKRYFLTGNLPSDENGGLVSVGENSSLYDKDSGTWITPPNGGGSRNMTDDIKEYQFAVQSGAFKGSFTDWQQKGIREQDPTFGREKDIRDEYTKGQEFKRYSDVRASYERVREGAKDASGAGDISLVYGFMKLLDPGSVVREGEFATAEQAGGVPTKIVALYNKIIDGQRLTPDQRMEFLRNAKNIYGQESKRIVAVNQRYTDIAKSYGLDPNRIVVAPTEYDDVTLQDLGGVPAPDSNPAQPAPMSSAPKPGAIENGYRFKGGNPGDPNSWEKVQ